MARIAAWSSAVAAVATAASVGGVIRAQDRYGAQVPDGLALSEFRGYEDWQVVAVSQTDEMLKAIVGNPATIAAYRAGVPGDGRPFPDGARMAKIEWRPAQNAEAPFAVRVPQALEGVGLMVRDSRRFPDSGGWGYAQFKYDAASDALVPDDRYSGTACGFACHTIVQAKDYVFTAYPRR